MAGKSTYLRQVALITLMAQIGSFVPAERARVGLVDRIFTRVGADDDLARGMSTFMLEMVETAYILRHATPRSLIILDEVGRGTSALDGLALARAVIEHLHDTVCPRTLFATHYHELAGLAETLPRLRVFQMAVAERDGEAIFLHRVEPGASKISYGIQVARMAGLPASVTTRARSLLDERAVGQWIAEPPAQYRAESVVSDYTGGARDHAGAGEPERRGDDADGGDQFALLAATARAPGAPGNGATIMTVSNIQPIAALPREVVERIAAGEVIERPASVVRELIENALDAGATSVRVELREGGLGLIRVADDGWGIPTEALELACQPHTTSKIAALADLDAIGSLGFRGEALASVCAVAEVEITSATDESGLAATITLAEGRVTAQGHTARSRGVTVTARALFAASPARLALLRGPRTETAQAFAVVRAYALIHPAVRFTFVADGALVFSTPGTTLADAAQAIYGATIARTLLPIEDRSIGEGARLSGAIASRATHFANREHVTLAVNGRPITNRALLSGLRGGVPSAAAQGAASAGRRRAPGSRRRARPDGASDEGDGPAEA